MHFTVVFVVVLAVSGASMGQGGDLPEGSTKATKSERELSAVLDSARVVNPQPDNNDEIIAASGQRMSVKTLIDKYESFQRSDTLQRTGRGGLLPPVEEIEKAIKEGKKFDPFGPVCELWAGSPTENNKKEWYEFLCF